MKARQATIYFTESKFISFINDEKNFNKKFFIHDQKSLNYALKEADIKEAVILTHEKKNYDTNNSKDSISSTKSSNSLKIGEILKENIIGIKQEKSIKVNKIFSKENFDKRYVGEKVYELDLNSKYYKDFILNEKKIDYIRVNQNWIKEIDNFYSNISSNSELLVVGPRGVGKTSNILIYAKLLGIPRLYFPIKKLINFNNRKWKKMFLYETIYALDDEKEAEKFKEYIEKISGSENLLEFIYDYIKLIFEFYNENKKKKRILIILDDYDDSLDSNNIILKIKDFIHKHREILLLCFLGECSYIYNQFYNYILNNHQNYVVSYWDIFLKDDEQKDFKKLPLYFYRNNDNSDFDAIVKNELTNEFKKINLKKFMSLSKYLNNFSDIRNLEDEFQYFPLEFLNVEIKNEDNTILIKISFKLFIYKEVFDEVIKGLLNIENIRSNLSLKNIEEGKIYKDGIEFEDIIVEQLWNNVLGLEFFSEKNKLIINDIYSLRFYDGKGFNIENNKPVIIRQTKPNGKFYDLLLILGPKKKRISLFIQIGLNKDGFKILKCYNNLYNNYKEYIKGINSFIHDDINDIGFILIFDYTRQNLLMKKNDRNEGVGYCLEHNIAYLIYKDFQLFEDLNSKTPITTLNIENTEVLASIEVSGKDFFENNYFEVCNNLTKKN